MKPVRHLALCLLLLCLARLAWAAELAASVMFTVGTVTIEAPDGSSRVAAREAELRAGEIVATGADGRAQLRFRDGATLSLNPMSRFRIDEYRYGTDGAREDRGFFSLLRGGFRTVTGLIGKQFREQYRVKTSVATIGIRGTVYTASLGDDGLRVATIQGRVEVCSDVACLQAGPGEGVHVPAADRKPILVGDGGGAMPVMPSVAPTAPPQGGEGSTVETPTAPAAAPARSTAPPAGSYPGTYPGSYPGAGSTGPGASGRGAK